MSSSERIRSLSDAAFMALSLFSPKSSPPLQIAEEEEDLWTWRLDTSGALKKVRIDSPEVVSPQAPSPRLPTITASPDLADDSPPLPPRPPSASSPSRQLTAIARKATSPSGTRSPTRADETPTRLFDRETASPVSRESSSKAQASRARDRERRQSDFRAMMFGSDPFAPKSNQVSPTQLMQPSPPQVSTEVSPRATALARELIAVQALRPRALRPLADGADSDDLVV